nr:integrase, catalytic region, zinc finger, CCHC-type, peptidase aspartic, catalytic [Tanacetum cinerariifolium]
MHNNIMATGLRDRPPMLATGRYAQSYTPSTVTIPAIPVTDDSPEVPERTAGKSLNIQDVKTNLFWEFGKFTSHDEESMESYYFIFYKIMNEMIRNNLTVATMQVNIQFLQQLQLEWSRFMTIVKQNYDLDIVSYHKFFDVLKQYQKEVNEIRVEKIAKNENPLALVAAAQPYPDPYYQAPKSQKSYAPPLKQASSTRSNASTKYKGKEMAKSITPLSESDFEEDSDSEQAQRDKDLQKNLALIAKYFKKIYKPIDNNLRTSLNSKNKNVDTFPRAKDSTYHKEKMLLCKQVEKCVPLKAEQADWLEDTDEEIDKQELESHYSYMAKIQEVPTADLRTDTEPLENSQKKLKKANAPLTQELNECKSILAETSKTLGESNSTRDSCLIALQSKQTELEMYKTLNDHTVDYEKLERVIHRTSFSRPQLRSTQMKDKVMPNNSQVKFKKTNIKDHHRILKNVYLIRIMMLVISKFIHDVNARAKKPKAVPISTRKPKSQGNKSVATPRYKWVLKTKMKWVPKVRKEDIVQLILLFVDYGCTKHMTGNLKLLCNFVEKYLGAVHFGNDQFALILSYGDLVQGNITINRVYYVKGINHNLFSVGQFCDADLQVAFRKSTCFVRDLQGNDLLRGNHGSELYTVSLQEITSLTQICFMAKASPTHGYGTKDCLILPSTTSTCFQRRIS